MHLAYCANVQSLNLLQTAAYAICKGRTRALDVFSVVQPPGRRYFAFLSIYYGMMANLDIGTDHLRFVSHAPSPPAMRAAFIVAWLGV